MCAGSLHVGELEKALGRALPCGWLVVIPSQNRRWRRQWWSARLGSSGREKGKEGRVERPKKARNHVSKIPFKENLTSIPVLLNQDSLKWEVIRVHYARQPMAINSLWQQYLRLEEHPGYGSDCWDAETREGTNTFLIDVKELKKIKIVPKGKEQLNEQGEQQITDRHCSFWHQSSVIHRMKRLFWG